MLASQARLCTRSGWFLQRERVREEATSMEKDGSFMAEEQPVGDSNRCGRADCGWGLGGVELMNRVKDSHAVPCVSFVLRLDVTSAVFDQ